MRPAPLVLGCGLVAFGVLFLLGDHLMGAAGEGAAVLDGLTSYPGVMIGVGLALVLYAFTSDRER